MAVLLIALGIAAYGIIIWLSNTVDSIKPGSHLLRVTGGFLIGSGLFLLLNRPNKIDWDVVLFRAGLAWLPVLGLAVVIQKLGGPADLFIIAYIIMLVSATYSAQGKGAQNLSSRPLFWLGEISFSLYLFHAPFFVLMSYCAKRLGIEQDIMFGIFCVAVSIGAAHLLYRFVEMPARDALRDWRITSPRAAKLKSDRFHQPSGEAIKQPG